MGIKAHFFTERVASNILMVEPKKALLKFTDYIKPTKLKNSTTKSLIHIWRVFSFTYRKELITTRTKVM